MKLSQELGTASYRIRGYRAGEVMINEHTYHSSLVVSPEHLITDWPPEAVDELTEQHIDRIKSLEPQVVLLGTGDRQQFPQREIMLSLLEQGIGVEVMDTAAACRTFNVLMAEDRKVAAVLFLR